MAIGSYSDFIEKCAEDCNCNGTLFSDSDGKTLVKKLAGEIDAKENHVFDFIEMGMKAITPGGDAVTLKTDTSEIRNALKNGAIRVRFNFTYYDTTMTGVAKVSPLYLEDSDEYQVVALAVVGGLPAYVSFGITQTDIIARSNML